MEEYTTLDWNGGHIFLPPAFMFWKVTIFDLSFALVKYCVTLTNIWPPLINIKHYIIFKFQYNIKIYAWNFWAHILILSFICRQMTNICPEIFWQIFPYYTVKIMMFIFHKFLWNICVTNLQVLEGEQYLTLAAPR